MHRTIFTTALLGMLVGALILSAQSAAQPPDLMLDAAARSEVIEGALKALNDGYVFPDVAKKMEEAIRARQQRHEYDTLTTGEQLAVTLTDHLRAVSKDRHLSVGYSRQVLPPEPATPQPGARPTPEEQARLERQAAMAARQNFGFVRLERLPATSGMWTFERSCRWPLPAKRLPRP